MPPAPHPRRHAVKRGRNSFTRRRRATAQRRSAVAHNTPDQSRALIVTPLTTLQGRGMENSIDVESVYSDFDLVTDVMQEVLFGSSSEEDEIGEAADDGNEAGGTLSHRALHRSLFASPFMAHTLYGSCSVDIQPPSSPKGRRGQSRRRRRDDGSGEPVSLSHTMSRPPRTRAERDDDDGANEHGRRWTREEEGSGRIATAPRSLLPALNTSHNYSFTVVLDLDETLVCVRQGPLYLRPHIANLLDVCAELRCEVVVWTAGTPTYVNDILRAIGRACGRTHWFHHIISRHRRWCGRGGANYAKDLRQLRRPLERLVIIENNPLSVALQPAQAILVEDYAAPDEGDSSLAEVSEALRYVARKASVASPTQPHPHGEGAASTRRSTVQSRPLRSVWTVPQALARCTLLTTAAFDVSGAAVVSSSSTSRRGEITNDAQSLLPQRVECRVLRYSPHAAQQARLYGCMHPITVTATTTSPVS